MALPLPELDTRRWDDLVDEGRALIPRYAPAWTDHNAHDPGITVMELLAWQVEQEMYRANRIPEAHRRKFLALAGYPVEPPRAARVTLALATAGAAPVALPAGLIFATTAGAGESIPFRLLHQIAVQPVTLSAVQAFDGRRFYDYTRLATSVRPFPAWGDAPGEADTGPALYLGLNAAPAAGSELRLWFAFGHGRSGPAERERIAAEAAGQDESCRPRGPFAVPDCGSQPPAAVTPPGPFSVITHHGMTTAWEYWDGATWAPLTVEDATRALTLDGAVIVTAPPAMPLAQVGEAPGQHAWLRCRLASGRADAAPLIRAVMLNAAVAEQATPARAVFEILPGVVPPAGREPAPGTTDRIEFAFDPAGKVTALAAGAPEPWPEAFVVEYVAAQADAPGRLVCSLIPCGQGTGLPGLEVELGGPISDGACLITSIAGADTGTWLPRPDLDAAGPRDHDFALDAAGGATRFGDGVHGRVPVRGSYLLASFSRTAGPAGNVAAGATWTLPGADDTWNASLLGGPVAAVAALLAPTRNPLPAVGGSLDDVAGAAGRAAQDLWAHERLLELVPEGGGTLDQARSEDVLGRPAPARATTLLDYERLALDVPGTAVARARAWAALDPAFPCLRAPGTVSVVVVPGLPGGRPEPTEGLLAMVRRYLGRRRTIGTRLLVVGPSYVQVRVHVSARTRPRADATRVAADIRSALDTFLDPLRGGPFGRGWPFGRDVFRSEVLQVVDGVAGVDHVLELELFAGDGEGECGNVCIGPVELATPGTHEVTVV